MIERDPTSEIKDPLKQELCLEHPILAELNHNFFYVPRHKASYEIQRPAFKEIGILAKKSLIDQVCGKLIYNPSDLSPQGLYDTVVVEFLTNKDRNITKYLMPDHFLWFNTQTRLDQLLPVKDLKVLFRLELNNFKKVFFTEAVEDLRTVSRFTDIASTENFTTLNSAATEFGKLLLDDRKSLKRIKPDPFAQMLLDNPHLKVYFQGISHINS